MNDDFFDFGEYVKREISSRPGFRGQSDGLFPSEASFEYQDKYGYTKVEGACQRKGFFQRIGVRGDSTTSPDTLHMFKVAKAIEQEMLDEYKTSGIYLGSNVKFRRHMEVNDTKFILSGEADGIIMDPKELAKPPEQRDTTPQLIELKSFFGYAAEKSIFGSKRPFVHGKPKPANTAQLMLYLDEFGNRYGTTTGHLHYIERGTGKSKSFQIKLDDNKQHGLISTADYKNRPTDFTLGNIYDRYARLQDCVNRDILPPKEFELQYSQDRIDAMYSAGDLGKTDKATYERGKQVSKGDWQCNKKYCPYHSICYGKKNIEAVVFEETGRHIIVNDSHKKQEPLDIDP